MISYFIIINNIQFIIKENISLNDNILICKSGDISHNDTTYLYLNKAYQSCLNNTLLASNEQSPRNNESKTIITKSTYQRYKSISQQHKCTKRKHSS